MNTFLHSLKVLFLVMVSVFSTNAFGQVDIIPVRTDVSGFPTWTDTDVAGTTYIQLVKATSSTVTPPMNFDSYTNKTLDFQARTFGGVQPSENAITISISVDNGSNWTVLGTRVPATTSLVNQTQFNLSAYTGNQVKIKFTVGGTSNSIGAGIDNIRIRGVENVSSFSLTYNGNGNTSGSVPASQPDLASGIPVTLANNTGSLVRTGFTFNGWNTVQNGGAGTHYAAGASYTMPSNNVTMYADWKALPKLSPSTPNISGFDYNLGAGPAEKTFILTGSGLNGSNVGLLVGGTDFQISADGATYSDNINYPAYDGSAKTVYVRLKAGLAAAGYTDQLLISGGGATDVQVDLSGEVKAPLLTANPLTLSGFTYHQGEGPSNSQSFSLSGQYLSGSQNVDILPGENWEVSTNQITWFTYDNPLILNNYAGAATPIYVRLKAGLAEGVYNNASNDIVVATGYGISAGPEVMLSGEVTAPLPPPVVTSATVSGTYHTPFNYTVTASNSPTSFAIVSGELPGGLSLNTTSGAIFGTPTAAGSFTAQISAANYSGTGSPAELIFNISKKAQTVTFGALSDKVYGDAPFTLSATADSGLAVAYSSSNPEVASVSGTTVTVTGAGTASITATQAGNSNYASATAVQDLNVTVRPLTVSGLTANHKVQDGNTSATLSGTAALTNVVAGDETLVSLSGTPVGTFASASPGTAVAVTVTGLSLTGDKAANYTLTPLVLSADITPLGAPVATAATNVGQNTFTANWNEVAGASGYLLDVYTKEMGTASELVLNGGFELGNKTNWTGTHTAFTIVNTGGQEGTNYVTRTGTATNQLEQIISNLTIGDSYVFSFWYKDYAASGVNGLKNYSIQGASGSNYIGSNPPVKLSAASEWTKYTVTFTAAETQMKISIRSYEPVSIDNISLKNSDTTVFVPFIGSPFTVAAPAVSHEVTGLTPQTEYYYTVKSKSGSVLSPKSNEIKVYPQSVGGTVSADQALCSGATPSDLTLSGHFGEIIRWESSLERSFAQPTVISETSAVLSGAAIGPLSVTTYFRAVVQSGDNPLAYSAYATVTVIPLAAAGTVSENQSVCHGAPPADLSLSGSTGTVQWQWSTDNVTFTDINGATSAVLSVDLVGSLTQTTYFRAQLSSGSCSTATSDVITVTVVPNVTVGTVSENQSICYGTQPADLSLSENTGTVQWQRSTDNVTFSDISGANSGVLSGDIIGSLTETTYFRAQLSNGICAPTASEVVIVTVIPKVVVGTLSENQSVCHGAQPANLSLSGSTGTVQWQWSTDNVTFTDINGATSAVLSGDLVGSLTQTTYFRAQLSSGSCSTATSDVITVTVVPNVTVGTVSENQSICYGTQPTDLSVTGSTGDIQWQWSTDNSVFTDIEGATASVLTAESIGNLTATTYFRAQLSNSVCSASSDVITVTVIPNVSAGPITGPGNVRLGYSAQFSTAGDAGGTWSSSNTDIATVGSNGLVTAIGYGSVDISYTVNSGCGSPATASVNIQINNTTTWTGSSWDYGVPDISVDAIIAGNLNTVERLVSKSLTINSGAVLTIAAEASFTTGDFGNNGTLVVESDGNFVQTEGSINSGSGTATVKRNARMKRLDYTYWGSPVHGTQTLKQFSPGTVDSRFMTYNTIDDTFSTVNPSTTVFMPAKGYAIRASNYYPVWTDPAPSTAYRTFEGIFTGKPNNGDISVSLAQTGQGYNLIANPYPSNLDLHALSDTGAVAHQFYFWSNANVSTGGTNYKASNYAVYTQTGGNPAQNGTVIPDRYIKVGQGLIVKAQSGDLTITNSMRNDGSGESTFINKGNQALKAVDRFWLTLTTPAQSGLTILIGYPEGATNGYDPQFDAEQLGESSDAFYSILEQRRLIIQGRQNPLEVTDVVPLGLKGFAGGQYKIALIKKNGIFTSDQKVYLKDKQTNTLTNLSEKSYTFTAPEGLTDQRFEIVYVDDVILSTGTATKSKIEVYRDGQSFTVRSPEQPVDSLELYDSSGRMVYAVKPNKKEMSIDAGILAEGVYILKISTKSGTVTQKILK